VVENDVEKLV
jgi:hypothetical protein